MLNETKVGYFQQLKTLQDRAITLFTTYSFLVYSTTFVKIKFHENSDRLKFFKERRSIDNKIDEKGLKRT